MALTEDASTAVLPQTCRSGWRMQETFKREDVINRIEASKNALNTIMNLKRSLFKFLDYYYVCFER